MLLTTVWVVAAARASPVGPSPGRFCPHLLTGPEFPGAARRCLKKYCECFQAGIFCSENCKCQDCKNFEGSEQRHVRRLMVQQQEKAQMEAASPTASAAAAAAASAPLSKRARTAGPVGGLRGSAGLSRMGAEAEARPKRVSLLHVGAHVRPGGPIDRNRPSPAFFCGFHRAGGGEQKLTDPRENCWRRALSRTR